MAYAAKTISALANKVGEWQFNRFPEFAMYIGAHSDETSLDPYNLQIYEDRQVKDSIFSGGLLFQKSSFYKSND